MPVISKYVVYDSATDFPTALLRFCKLRFPQSDGDVVAFFPTVGQMNNFPHFLRMVREMETAGLDLSAGLFLVDPAKEWLENEKNFVRLDSNEDLRGPVQEDHVQLGDGVPFRHSSCFRKSMKLSAFRALASRTEDPDNAADLYEQDAADSPPYSTVFFNAYFAANQRLLRQYPATRNWSSAKREAVRGLLEPPVYAANLDGSLLFDECRDFNLDSLGTALDHVRPVIPGVSTAYRYFGMKGTCHPWHFEDQNLMSILYLGMGSAPKIWYACPDRDGFERFANETFPAFFAKCKHQLAHKECVIAPELVRRAGLPLHICIQAAGSFVVTRYGVAHAVWNSDYNEACAVNLLDDDYRDVGLRFLRDELYCTCDQLKWLRGEREAPAGDQAFWDIVVQREEHDKAVVVRTRRRREVVRFNLHYFRECFRANTERQQQSARIAELEMQLRGDAAQTRILQLEHQSASNQLALRTFLQNAGHFFRCSSWKLADGAPPDAACMALWIREAASGSVDDFMRRAGVALAHLPFAALPVSVVDAGSTRPSSAPPGVATVLGNEDRVVAPDVATSSSSAEVRESAPGVGEPADTSAVLVSGRLLPGSSRKKLSLVLLPRTPSDVAADRSEVPVALGDADVMLDVRDVLSSVVSRVAVAELIPARVGSTSPLECLTDSQMAEVAALFPSNMELVTADDVDNELLPVAPVGSADGAVAPASSSAVGRTSPPSDTDSLAQFDVHRLADADESASDVPLAHESEADDDVVFAGVKVANRRDDVASGSSKGARKRPKREPSSSPDSNASDSVLRCQFCGKGGFATRHTRQRHEKFCRNNPNCDLKCKCTHWDYRAGEQWQVDQHFRREHLSSAAPSKRSRSSTSQPSDDDFL